MYTFQALQILLFLIPGFISSAMLYSLVIRHDKSELSRIIEALVFSLLTYALYSLIKMPLPISLLKAGEEINYTLNPLGFLWLVLISIALPLLLSLFITNDWHMKIARKLLITRRTARTSVWFDVFYDIKKHIIINFENGRRIFGWPMYYSNDPEKQYIFLHKPAWIVKDAKKGEEKYVDLAIEGILITPEQRIESIEFLQD